MDNILKLIKSSSDEDRLLGVTLLLTHKDDEVENFFKIHGGAYVGGEGSYYHIDNLPFSHKYNNNASYITNGTWYICICGNFIDLDTKEQADRWTQGDYTSWNIINVYEQ